MALRGSHNSMVIIMTKLFDTVNSPRLNTLSVTGVSSVFRWNRDKGEPTHSLHPWSYPQSLNFFDLGQRTMPKFFIMTLKKVNV
jgi:hypothetical protein